MDKKAILKRACGGQGGPLKDKIIGVGKFIKAIPKKVIGKTKQIIKDRIQAQKNFEKRTNNKDYYKGYKSFIK